jgi:hypothetical protein
MTQLSIQVHGELVRKGLQNLADEVPKIGRLQIYQTSLRIRTGMRQPGAKPTHPINWASVKQLKAFYASEGFGGGIPHRRTDEYVNGWVIEPIGDQGYMLVNKTAGAQYIGGNAYGQMQSPIHRGRWPVFRDVADREVEKLPQEINEQIKMVARREGLA